MEDGMNVQAIPATMEFMSAPFTRAGHIRSFMNGMCTEGGQLLLRWEEEGVDVNPLARGIQRVVESESAKGLGGSQNRTRNLERKLACLRAASHSLDEGS